MSTNPHYDEAKQIAFKALIKKTNSWEKYGTRRPEIIEAVRQIADQVLKLEEPIVTEAS